MVEKPATPAHAPLVMDGIHRMTISAIEQEAVVHIENILNLAAKAKEKNPPIYRQLLNAAVHHGHCATEMGHMANKLQHADTILLNGRLQIRALEDEINTIKSKLKHAN